MNADLHMGGDLKPTGKANLFVVFGEPDIDILHGSDGALRVHVKGVDVFDPATGDVGSDAADGIACRFIDTDYNEESFFVRHAYFLGQNDLYGALRTTLKAEIDTEAWATLHSDDSRPFPKPASGRRTITKRNSAAGCPTCGIAKALVEINELELVKRSVNEWSQIAKWLDRWRRFVTLPDCRGRTTSRI